MFAKHPLDLAREALEKGDTLDALRLAIIAELDAISFYLQVARHAKDPAVRRVFEDVAREEMTHFGEFAGLLLRLQPEQAQELLRGLEEVKELTSGGGDKEGDDLVRLGEELSEALRRLEEAGERLSHELDKRAGVGDPAEAALEAQLVAVFREEAERLRLLRKHLPVTRVGPGVDYVTVQSVAYSGQAVTVETENIVSLREVAIEFLIPLRLLERARRLGTDDHTPIVAQAARRLVASEERLLLESLLGLEGALEANMGSWERPGEAVDDIAKAIARMETEGVTGPYVLIIPPQRYAKLLAVHEKTGIMELARLEKLAKVVRHPLLPPDKAILAPRDTTVLDIVIGTDTRIDDLGVEAGAHRLRAWETLALRAHYPRGVTILTQA